MNWNVRSTRQSDERVASAGSAIEANKEDEDKMKLGRTFGTKWRTANHRKALSV